MPGPYQTYFAGQNRVGDIVGEGLADAFAMYAQGKRQKKLDTEARDREQREQAWQNVVRELTMQDQGVVRNEDANPGAMMPGSGSRRDMAMPQVQPNPMPDGSPMLQMTPRSMAPTPGAFDPASGTFAPLVPRFQKMGNTGFSRDMQNTPEAKRLAQVMAEREQALADEQRHRSQGLADYGEKKRIDAQYASGSKDEQIRKRISELVVGGKTLKDANEIARLEFGETVPRDADVRSQFRGIQIGIGLTGQYQGNATVKAANEVANSLANIKSAKPTAAGDMHLLYAYMKLLDPNSVVRETEFATAAKSGSLGQQMQTLVSKLANGERLTPEQRASFISEGEQAAGAFRAQLKGINDYYTDLARRSKVDSFMAFDPFDTVMGPSKPMTREALVDKLIGEGKTDEQIRVELQRAGYP